MFAADVNAKLPCAEHCCFTLQGHALFVRQAGGVLPCPQVDFTGGFNGFLAAAYGLGNSTVEEVYGAAFGGFIILCCCTAQICDTSNMSLLHKMSCTLCSGHSLLQALFVRGPFTHWLHMLCKEANLLMVWHSAAAGYTACSPMFGICPK